MNVLSGCRNLIPKGTDWLGYSSEARTRGLQLCEAVTFYIILRMCHHSNESEVELMLAEGTTAARSSLTVSLWVLALTSNLPRGRAAGSHNLSSPHSHCLSREPGKSHIQIQAFCFYSESTMQSNCWKERAQSPNLRPPGPRPL